MKIRAMLALGLLMLLLGGLVSFSAQQKTITFISSQLRPIEEAAKVREVILPPFTAETGVKVEFVTAFEGPLSDTVVAQHTAGRVTLDVVGALHGEFPTMVAAGAMAGLDGLQQRLARDRTFIIDFVRLGKLGSDTQRYVPWMQATFLLVVNRKALQFLPAGADVNALTYEQLA